MKVFDDVNNNFMPKVKQVPSSLVDATNIDQAPEAAPQHVAQNITELSETVLADIRRAIQDFADGINAADGSCEQLLLGALNLPGLPKEIRSIISNLGIGKAGEPKRSKGETNRTMVRRFDADREAYKRNQRKN